MSQKSFMLTTASIFGLIAVLHLIRLIAGWDASIAGWAVPNWLSIAAFLVAAYLAFEGFRWSKRG